MQDYGTLACLVQGKKNNVPFHTLESNRGQKKEVIFRLDAHMLNKVVKCLTNFAFVFIAYMYARREDQTLSSKIPVHHLPSHYISLPFVSLPLR